MIKIITLPQLVIDEKLSVAQSIAKVLGVTSRCNGCMENSTYIVSWCVGYLVELAPPSAYNETYAKWSLNDLPILPQKTEQGWQHLVSESTKKQFAILKSLMERILHVIINGKKTGTDQKSVRKVKQ